MAWQTYQAFFKITQRTPTPYRRKKKPSWHDAWRQQTGTLPLTLCSSLREICLGRHGGAALSRILTTLPFLDRLTFTFRRACDALNTVGASSPARYDAENRGEDRAGGRATPGASRRQWRGLSRLTRRLPPHADDLVACLAARATLMCFSGILPAHCLSGGASFCCAPTWSSAAKAPQQSAGSNTLPLCSHSAKTTCDIFLLRVAEQQWLLWRRS